MGIRDAWFSSSDREVTCIACGEQLPRSSAREYDRYGDRWDRTNKRFEYLCKPCHRDCSHYPREGLEATLVEAGAGTTDRETFLRRFCDLTAEDAVDSTSDAG